MAEQRDERAEVALLILRERVAQLEAGKAELEERFRALVEGSFEGLTISIAGKIVEANATFAKLGGYTREEVLGLGPFDLAVPESAAVALERIRGGSEAPYEAVGRRKDGSTFACEVQGRNIVYQGQAARLTGFRDITERKRQERERRLLEERMLQVQKLQTLGVLAGGIAHEFNNLMLVVLGHAELGLELLRVDARGEGPLNGHLEQIKDVVKRARALTGQMLTYAGRAQPDLQRIDLGELVRNTSELLQRSLGERARWRFELDPALPAIVADPAQLRQVLDSLITNAAEALGEADGEIAISADALRLSASELEGLHSDHTRGPGRFVRLTVEDTGSGMDAATRARIFEPFFSTKWTGRGLGLPAVLGIVRAHRGAIRVLSEKGRGARVEVLLPCDEAPLALAEPQPMQAASEWRPSGLALLADDERLLRDVGAEILRSVGFEVVTARDGLEALAQFKARRDEIEVVLLDATMPRMSGGDALRAIRALDRQIPVILMSGYHDTDPELLAGDACTTFLAKPFEIGTLLHKLGVLLK